MMTVGVDRAAVETVLLGGELGVPGVGGGWARGVGLVGGWCAVRWVWFGCGRAGPGVGSVG
ncbi:MAG: hypothetical protein M3Y48_22385 [Actinomycetota bacterium]|nr:hypothetical protein [Actinomycetota bacterium]